MHSVVLLSITIKKKNKLVLHDNFNDFNDLMLSSRNSSIYRDEIIATLSKDIYRNCEILASQSFPNPTYHARRSNRMQQNKIARSSIYSRGVLAVVGKAEFCRLRFEESARCVQGSCYWKPTERTRRKNVNSNRGYIVLLRAGRDWIPLCQLPM